jgi:hypothetical protein
MEVGIQAMMEPAVPPDKLCLNEEDHILTWTCITKKAVNVMKTRCRTNGSSNMEHAS